MTNNNLFCPDLLMIGLCRKDKCRFRHFLNKSDIPRECIPRNGDIKFEVIKVHTPAYYTVRLLEHRPVKQHQWLKYPYADNYFTFKNEFHNYFNDTVNHKIHQSPELDDLCVINEEDGGECKRCKIIDINRTK